MPNTGIKPATLPLLAWRSNQLSYAAAKLVNLELAWVWSKHAPTLFLTDLLKILNTRFDSVSKIPTTTAVTTTVSVKKTQYIHTETTQCMIRFIRYTLGYLSG